MAYVGGGLKTGLHNILEPATFGIPVVIGNKYQKFKEAVDLVRLNGCISISNQSEFSTIFTKLNQDKNFRLATGNINKKYIHTVKNNSRIELSLKNAELFYYEVSISKSRAFIQWFSV